jgi:hypothetical protein
VSRVRVDARCCNGKAVAGTGFPFQPCCDFLDATATLLRFFYFPWSSVSSESRAVSLNVEGSRPTIERAAVFHGPGLQ